jgi:hypothetical protein
MTTNHEQVQRESATGSPEYRISSIADFLSVPAAKQAELLRDFAGWLDLARDHAMLDEIARAIAGPAVAFNTTTFTWIDDGIDGCTALDFRTDDGGHIARLAVVPVTVTGLRPCRNALINAGATAWPKSCPRCGLVKNCPDGVVAVFPDLDAKGGAQ